MEVEKVRKGFDNEEAHAVLALLVSAGGSSRGTWNGYLNINIASVIGNGA
jgi:hypothetical protein